MTDQQIKAMVISHPRHNGTNGCMICYHLGFSSNLSSNFTSFMILCSIGVFLDDKFAPILLAIFFAINIVLMKRSKDWNKRCNKIFEYEQNSIINRVKNVMNTKGKYE